MTLPSAEVRVGRWQDVLSLVTADALIFDPPYGDRTHAVEVERNDGSTPEGLAPGYEAWSPDHVHECVRSWSPRITGWIAALTSHDLIPAWEAAHAEAGRYCFAPVPCVINGMSVRMLGDGPSSWAVYLMVARPRNLEMMAWGTLPGAYVVNASRDSTGGRGKPKTLMDAIVRDYSREGDLVVDPCAGFGVTLTSARKLGRRSIGAEVVPEIAAEAQRRIVGAARGGQADLFDPSPTFFSTDSDAVKPK